MLSIDPSELVTQHQRDLIAELESAHLAALLPKQPSMLRRGLAAMCLRLAAWLDAPAGYVQLPESGPEDWVTPWARV